MRWWGTPWRWDSGSWGGSNDEDRGRGKRGVQSTGESAGAVNPCGGRQGPRLASRRLPGWMRVDCVSMSSTRTLSEPTSRPV
jgi:hypothetical protein